MDAPELEQTDEGVLLPVQAQPRSGKNEMVGWHDGRLKVRITQVPEKGKANQALLKVLVKSLGLSRSQIELVSGETSSRKVFCVQTLPPDQLHERIAAVLPESR